MKFVGVVMGLCPAPLAANTINIAADIAGMADAAEMLSGIKTLWWFSHSSFHGQQFGFVIPDSERDKIGGPFVDVAKSEPEVSVILARTVSVSDDCSRCHGTNLQDRAILTSFSQSKV